MQRALALATFAEGTTMLRRPSESDDCTQAMMMSAQLGATLELGDDAVAVHGVARPAPRVDTLTPGESGLGARTFGALAALHDQPPRWVVRARWRRAHSKVGPRRCVRAAPRWMAKNPGKACRSKDRFNPERTNWTQTEPARSSPGCCAAFPC